MLTSAEYFTLKYIEEQLEDGLYLKGDIIWLISTLRSLDERSYGFVKELERLKEQMEDWRSYYAD